jgi:hypothetical protein
VSVQAMAWVIDKSTHGGSPLLVLLMIANNADTDGFSTVPIQDLALQCRLGKRTVSRIIAEKLDPSGELITTRWLYPDSRTGKGKHQYQIPGVIRDGYHARGIPAKLRQPIGQVGRLGNRPNGATQSAIAVADSTIPLKDRTTKSNTTPPYPPAVAGGRDNSYRYSNPPKPPNRFPFEWPHATLEVLVPIGRKLWRNSQECEKFRARLEEARDPIEATEMFFKMKGFQVERKISLDTGGASNILPCHIASANEYYVYIRTALRLPVLALVAAAFEG